MVRKYFFWLTVGLWVIATGCKPTQVAVGDYTEDISVYRIDIDPVDHVDPDRPGTPDGKKGKKDEGTKASKAPKASAIKPELAINDEIDKKLTLISRRNAEISSTYGYKILVYSGRSRDEASKIQSRLMMRESAEVAYETPNWRVKVGNFFTKLDAHELYVKLLDEYPQAIIIPDVIQVNLDRFLRDE